MKAKGEDLLVNSKIVYDDEAFTKLPYELTKGGYAILDTSSLEKVAHD